MALNQKDLNLGGISDFITDMVPFFYGRAVNYVDVGAFRGETFAAMINSPLSVRESILVEPNPESILEIQKVIKEIASTRTVYFHKSAVGAKQGVVELKGSLGMTKVTGSSTEKKITKNEPAEGKFAVTCDTLENLTLDLSTKHISILKIDVEGYEIEVLEGAKKLLSENKVDVIYIEAGMDPSNTQQVHYRKIEDFLQEYNYRVFRFYEQMFEWTQDSPILRRMNIAFISSQFAKNNPYKSSIEIFKLKDEIKNKNKDIKSILSDLADTNKRSNLEQKKRAESEAHFEELTKKLEKAHEKYSETEAKSSEKLSKLNEDLNLEQKKRAESEAHFEELTKKLEKAHEKYSETEAKSSEKLSKLNEELLVSRDKAQLVTTKLTKVREALRDSETKIKILQKQSQETNDKLIATRNSTSFRFGNSVVRNIKSPFGWIKNLSKPAKTKPQTVKEDTKSNLELESSEHKDDKKKIKKSAKENSTLETEDLVFQSSTPTKKVNDLLEQKTLSMQSAGELLSRIMIDRTQVSYNNAMNEKTKLKAPELEVLRKIYRKEFRGELSTQSELEADWEVINKSDYNPTESNKRYFLLSAIKARSIDMVESFILKNNVIELGSIPSTYKVGILRLISKERPSLYEFWRDSLNLSPLEYMKILDIDYSMGQDVTTSHESIISSFLDAAPKQLRHELETDILSFYKKFEDQMKWMNCRLDDNMRREFINLIKTKLTQREAWSLIRIGDGESYAWQEKLTRKQYEMRERMWWDKSIEPALRQKISGEMKNAIISADVLGIPSIFRFIRDTTENLQSYAEHQSISGLIKALEGIRESEFSNHSFTEDRIHQICFDVETVKDIIGHADSLIVISSIKGGVLDKIFGGIKIKSKTHYLNIPSHSKTMNNKLYVSSNNSLPYVYNEVNAELEALVRPGTLVLIAAGSIGKIFCETSRVNGGVALDIGAMADYWVGVKTRSIADIV